MPKNILTENQLRKIIREAILSLTESRLYEDSGDKMKATVEWMSRMYDKANMELFNGELGPCEFKIDNLGTRTLGRFQNLRNGVGVNRYTRRMSYQGTPITRDNFVDLFRPLISLNSKFSGTELALYGTLVHEMCHYYTYMNGLCPKQAHGTEFRRIGSIVSSRSNGLISIERLARAEEMANYELDSDLKDRMVRRAERKAARVNYIFVKYSNSEIRLLNTHSSELIDQIIYLAKKYSEKTGRTDVFVAKLTNDKLAKEFYNRGYKKEMRVYRYWEMNIFDQTMEKVLDSGDYEILFSADSLTESVNEEISEMANDEDSIIMINPSMPLSEISPLEM